MKYVGYRNTTIDGVHAKAAGKSSDGGAQAKASAAEDVLTVALKPDEQQLKGVTVTGVKRRNTVTAAVLEVKNSPVIVSNISAQDIKLTQDANAGEVIRRVPGVSLIDDKFVMVRGLAQRYNNVWMNGGAVPSSEADQRAFSFDMIPSNQIDNLTIVKAPTPEYPADYTGGFIMIDTKEIPLENAFHVSVGGNWNSASAFQSFLGTKQSGTDFLGFDNGLRSLHGGIDATLADLGKNSGGNTMYSLSDNHLNNDWKVKNQHPWGDLKLSADWSHSWTLPVGKLGAIAAVNYTNEYRVYRDMINNFYGAYDTQNDRSNPLRLSTDNQYNHNVRLGALFNMTLLSASIGLTLEAFSAGMSPAMVPAMMMTRVACIQTSSPTVGLRNIVAWKSPVSTTSCPIVASIYSFAAIPQSIPMYPKIAVVMTLSIMISLSICHGFAPLKIIQIQTLVFINRNLTESC